MTGRIEFDPAAAKELKKLGEMPARRIVEFLSKRIATLDDPRTLGDNECSAFELGLATREAKALQQVAFDQLASTGAVTAGTLPSRTGGAARCAR